MINDIKHTTDESPSTYREALQKIGIVLSFTRGVSMRPLIYQGIGYVGIVAVEEPQVGDLLLFEQVRNGSPITILHRLISIEGDTYVTRGDNCLGCERITRADIIGKADTIYWLKSKRYRFNPHLWLMPRLLRAQRDDRGYSLRVSAQSQLRYAKLWSDTWPLRRQAYRLRALAYRAYRWLRRKV